MVQFYVVGGLVFIVGSAIVVFIFKYKKMKRDNENLKVKEEVSEVNEKITDKYVLNDQKKEDIKNEGEGQKDKNPIVDADSAADALNGLQNN